MDGGDGFSERRRGLIREVGRKIRSGWNIEQTRIDKLMEDWRSDRLTDWRTYVLQCKNRTLFFLKKAKPFLKKISCDTMEKGRVKFSIIFHQLGWNSSRIFCYINWNCVFSKNILKMSLAPWRKVRLNFLYHFINQGEILSQMAML